MVDVVINWILGFILSLLYDLWGGSLSMSLMIIKSSSRLLGIWSAD